VNVNYGYSKLEHCIHYQRRDSTDAQYPLGWHPYTKANDMKWCNWWSENMCNFNHNGDVKCEGTQSKNARTHSGRLQNEKHFSLQHLDQETTSNWRQGRKKNLLFENNVHRFIDNPNHVNFKMKEEKTIFFVRTTSKDSLTIPTMSISRLSKQSVVKDCPQDA